MNSRNDYKEKPEHPAPLSMTWNILFFLGEDCFRLYENPFLATVPIYFNAF